MSTKKIQEYKNEHITITYDPNICEHAAECVKGSPTVFNAKARPWITPDGAPLADIQATIGKCPTGALRYKLAGDSGESVTTTGPVEITVVPNGPLRLQGNIEIRDMDGKVLQVTDKCSLCRCGASKNKPYCDGAHKTIGFEAP
ncbi:MAG: (4Fe-4S)-binding protein [Bacteroidota bacterium]